MKSKEKPWGGRFRKKTDKQVEVFTTSIHFDRRLYRWDIEGSIAHARMLSKQKIIKKTEGKAIVEGLKDIKRDIEKNTFIFHSSDEDIHMAIEKALIKRKGDAGEKLHTARSRNDQIALDVRLYLREEISIINGLLRRLCDSFITLSVKESKTIMPGYTHMQRAQPVLLSHYFMAYREMFDRDASRLRECYERVNVMPLGSAAVAGTGLPIDRNYTAKLLKFPRISNNSMDAVSDRDFIIEFVSISALLMMHLSRFSEDLIMWSTDEFQYVEIDDAFTTGSSIMPQKKNPDVAELIRGKTSRVYGNLMSLLTLMKGLPMTYNRDLQEDKEPLFDTVDTVKSCIDILNSMLRKITYNRKQMLINAESGFSTATDAAEYLVKKGVPFRTAHNVVGKMVAYCITKKKTLGTLSMKEFQYFHAEFTDDIYAYLTVDNSVMVKNCVGGTSEVTIRERIRELKKIRTKTSDDN